MKLLFILRSYSTSQRPIKILSSFCGSTQLSRVDFYNLPVLASPSSSLTYKSPAVYHLGSTDAGQLKFVFPPWGQAVFILALTNFLISRSVCLILPFRSTFLGTMSGFSDPPCFPPRSPQTDLDQNLLPLCFLTP